MCKNRPLASILGLDLVDCRQQKTKSMKIILELLAGLVGETRSLSHWQCQCFLSFKLNIFTFPSSTWHKQLIKHRIYSHWTLLISQGPQRIHQTCHRHFHRRHRRHRPPCFPRTRHHQRRLSRPWRARIWRGSGMDVLVRSSLSVCLQSPGLSSRAEESDDGRRRIFLAGGNSPPASWQVKLWADWVSEWVGPLTVTALALAPLTMLAMLPFCPSSWPRADTWIWPALAAEEKCGQAGRAPTETRPGPSSLSGEWMLTVSSGSCNQTDYQLLLLVVVVGCYICYLL